LMKKGLSPAHRLLVTDAVRYVADLQIAVDPMWRALRS